MTADEFVQESRAMIEAGASFIGGCCGSSPEFIRALAQSLRRPV
jgi:5-methyltetrahydrofolate--homocysteine methyltransferase